MIRRSLVIVLAILTFALGATRAWSYPHPIILRQVSKRGNENRNWQIPLCVKHARVMMLVTYDYAEEARRVPESEVPESVKTWRVFPCGGMGPSTALPRYELARNCLRWIGINLAHSPKSGPEYTLTLSRGWFVQLHRSNVIMISAGIWLPFAICAPFPAWTIIRCKRNRRAVRLRQGLRVACAYDLTGNVSGVCPECGTAMDAIRDT